MAETKGNSIEFENEMLMLGVYALVVRGMGGDMLMGKNVKYYLQLTGLESLLKKFIKDLDNLFKYVYENNIPEFLKEMTAKFGIDFLYLDNDIENNIIGMRSVESDEIMIQYMIITKTLEEIREKVFKDFRNNQLIPKIKEIKGMELDEEKLESLKGKAKEDYSLLYNLTFIEFLARFYKDEKMIGGVREIINKKTENIANSIK